MPRPAERICRGLADAPDRAVTARPDSRKNALPVRSGTITDRALNRKNQSSVSDGHSLPGTRAAHSDIQLATLRRSRTRSGRVTFYLPQPDRVSINPTGFHHRTPNTDVRSRLRRYLHVPDGIADICKKSIKNMLLTQRHFAKNFLTHHFPGRPPGPSQYAINLDLIRG